MSSSLKNANTKGSLQSIEESKRLIAQLTNMWVSYTAAYIYHLKCKKQTLMNYEHYFLQYIL